MLQKASLNFKSPHPEGQIIFGITPLGYPRVGFKKTSNKERKSLEEIAEFL